MTRTKGTATSSSLNESADSVLALIAAAGLRGFKSGEKAAALDQPAAAETDPVLKIIAAANLPGFRKRGERDEKG